MVSGARLMNILLHDRYRLDSILGIGGQAVVYKALDEQLKVDRAIKVLSPQLMYEDRARQRFEAEARIMAGLDHPNVAQVYDIVSTSKYFIVMELWAISHFGIGSNKMGHCLRLNH